MLKQTSQKFRILFLTEFTKELIKNSETAEARAIRKTLREKIKENIEKKENEERLRKIVEQKAITKELENIAEQKIKPKSIKQIINQFTIPQPQIPITIQGVKPFPEEVEINLGKLNPLIKDPTVNSIECDGPGKNIIVKRIKGERRITNIILNEQEIREIIKIFSKQAKIPENEGIFKAAVGRLIISAITSDLIGSKFLITKMPLMEYYGR